MRVVIVVLSVCALFLMSACKDNETTKKEEPTATHAVKVGPTEAATATATARVEPTASGPPEPAPTVGPRTTNRQDCDAIRGTDYFSVEERSWFLSNCVIQQPAPQQASPQLPPLTGVSDAPGTVTEGDISTGGGQLASRDGRLLLVFPSDAVAENLHVKITSVSVTAFDSMSERCFVTIWKFEAFALDRGMAEVDQFPSNIRIIANYAVDDLFALAPETLTLWTLNKGTGQWEQLPGGHIPDTLTAVGETNHLGTFSTTAGFALLLPQEMRCY